MQLTHKIDLDTSEHLDQIPSNELTLIWKHIIFYIKSSRITGYETHKNLSWINSFALIFHSLLLLLRHGCFFLSQETIVLSSTIKLIALKVLLVLFSDLLGQFFRLWIEKLSKCKRWIHFFFQSHVIVDVSAYLRLWNTFLLELNTIFPSSKLSHQQKILKKYKKKYQKSLKNENMF